MNINLKSEENVTGGQFRCIKCGKMIAKSGSFLGAEIKCLRCGTLNRVFEKMIEQVIITDNNGLILFINKAVEIATGYTMHEAIGKKPSQLWGGHMSKEFYADMWAEMVKNKKPIKLKMTNVSKNGETYEVELLISPILDTSGETMFFVGIEIVV